MSNFAKKIAEYMTSQGYKLFTNPGELNIIYVEGVNADGVVNSDQMNKWNDRRLVLNHDLQIIGNWAATTEPGWNYTAKPLNPMGAFRIAFGQYKAWIVGIHKDHEALVQVSPVRGHQDRNKDGFRTGDSVVNGTFGINQHWGGDAATVGAWSAGCLVGQSRQGHRQFMQMVKTDARYRENPNYVFWTTVLPGDKLSF
ncbi:hypothetical protein [Microseira wollei]|uniref:Uncharacterized protein n=1 Tax=Microseira wollei NIES-4236 TaxID=2530354 RepID=A0AAV3XN84_9CYAN|nr:hypothetical protein [Microseira wollei]GET44168.1 hypothetical protein MiSe_89940 [Microseira wollei NIES-4236]